MKVFFKKQSQICIESDSDLFSIWGLQICVCVYNLYVLCCSWTSYLSLSSNNCPQISGPFIQGQHWFFEAEHASKPGMVLKLLKNPAATWYARTAVCRVNWLLPFTFIIISHISNWGNRNSLIHLSVHPAVYHCLMDGHWPGHTKIFYINLLLFDCQIWP